mgnify:CR=1 FL=1
MDRKPKVIILDDNDLFAALMVAALEADCDIVVGKNGQDGIQLCRAGSPDLLVTDIGMPELDGVQMLAEFQKDQELSAIPVIVVTATHFTQRNMSEVKRYPQVRSLLFKTVDMDIILREIRKILKESRDAEQGAP